MAALTSFYDWLAKQKNMRTSLGSFAREVARDRDFPREVASLDALVEYLQATANKSPQTVAVARSAYRTYERTHSPPPRA